MYESTIFSFTAHCQKAKYDIGWQTYDALSQIAIQKDTPERVNKTKDAEQESKREENETTENNTKNQTNSDKKETDNYRYLSLYYGTTDVKVSTTSELIDFSTFISNVGGNLGLFVGFSVLGGFFFIYDIISSYCRSLDSFQ